MSDLDERLVEYLEKLRRENKCVVQIIGPRDSGKTLVITELIKMLRQSYPETRVLVIKHSHHKRIDVEEKDSFRYLEAGGDAALVFVEGEYALFSRKIDPLEILGSLSVDIVFLEGLREYESPMRIDLGEKRDSREVIKELYQRILESKCLSRRGDA